MRRRHKVALRPEVRRQRQVRLAASVGLLSLFGASVWVYRRIPEGALRPSNLVRRIPAPEFLIVERISVVGAPDAVTPAIEKALAPRAGKAWGPSASGAVEAELLERFAFLESARVQRDLRARAAAVAVVLRTPVARASREKGAPGWLSDTGRLYEAPEGTYPPMTLPAVELGDGEGSEHPELASFITAASRELPGGLGRVAYRSAERGWDVVTADGTSVLWGALDWTDEKLARLREVLRDASPRFGPGLTADLRYFEDGRILVRPAAAPVARAR